MRLHRMRFYHFLLVNAAALAVVMWAVDGLWSSIMALLSLAASLSGLCLLVLDWRREKVVREPSRGSELLRRTR